MPDYFEEFFKNLNFTPNEETKKLLKEAGNQLAASLMSAAALSAVMQIIKNGLFAPKTTRIELDASVPTEIFAVKNKSGNPEAVYISSKKRKINLAPAFALALTALFFHIISSADDKETGEKIKVDANV